MCLMSVFTANINYTTIERIYSKRKTVVREDEEGFEISFLGGRIDENNNKASKTWRLVL